MTILLDELKRQRAHIQKHLEWLDEKIRELTTRESDTKNIADESPLPQDTRLYSHPEALKTKAHPEQNEPTATSLELDPKAPQYKAKTGDEIRRAKIGCLLFFIIGILLFLSLLFGLPYLL